MTIYEGVQLGIILGAVMFVGAMYILYKSYKKFK